MGFEQLANLRDELAAKAKQERNAKRSKTRPNAAAKPATPVDPVVISIGKLQKRYPLAFPKNPAPKVPLKVGIWDDLASEMQELGLSEAELREAVATWCRGSRYWTCLVEGAARVDLQGNEVGQVSREDAARARRMKARRPAKAAKAPTQSAKDE